jgi:hypothetical protein
MRSALGEPKEKPREAGKFDSLDFARRPRRKRRLPRPIVAARRIGGTPILQELPNSHRYFGVEAERGDE